MRIRSQLIAVIALTLLIGLVAALLTVSAANDEDRAGDRQARAQTASHEVSGLLVLTQEYARHSEDRASQQWHQRHQAITSALNEEYASTGLSPALREFRSVAEALPELFTSLEELPRNDDAFTQRRKEVLLDQLLTSTQAMSDFAYQWYQEAARSRVTAQARFHGLAIGSPIAIFLMLLAVAMLVQQRVLLPLAQLDAATTAVARGDLSVRIANGDPDEIGQLSRRFDAMTEAVAQSDERMQRTQKQLEAVMDNMPALIAYVDHDGIYRFINEFGHRLGVELGSSVLSIKGETYTVVAPNVTAALRGERRAFEKTTVAGSGDKHYRTIYIPDEDGDGKVSGFYEMTLDITERKNERMQHIRSEQRIRSIITHAPDAFISIDSQSHIREWNQQAETIFGWKRDEVMGKNLAELLIPPEHRAGHNNGMKRFSVTGEGPVVNQRIEITALHRDGHTIPVELSIATVHEGKFFAANAFVRDISQRKLAETLLVSSERRLRQITDHIPAMVGHFDQHENCLYANSTVLRASGIREEDTHKHTLRSGLGEEIYALHEPYVRRVLQGEVANFEGHVVRKGRDVYLQIHMVPEVTASGVVEGFYVMTFDVTAVRRAEVERSRSERLLRAITDNMPVLISYIDPQHHLQFANETYRNWLGVDPRLAIGRHVREAIGPSLYEERRAYIERALAGARVEFESEAAVLGKERSTHTSYLPDLDAEGAVKGIYALTTDVSALKKIERQLHAQARFDILTGLPNRLQFNEKMREALVRAARTGEAIALMFLDIDHFKFINDTHGHASGDGVLRDFAKRLSSNVRAIDTVARLAGDEFVIILEGLHTEAEAQGIAHKIIGHMAEPMAVANLTLQVTTSIGVAFHARTQVVTTAHHLVSTADHALYAAKAAGRNTYRLVALPVDESPTS